jgi:peptidoglycan-N-acetylglucosamine deacetylase
MVLPIGRLAVVAALGLAASGLQAASAEELALINRCWTQMLASSQQELKSTRSGAKLDRSLLSQDTVLPAEPVAQELRGSIRSVELPPGLKLIALTFDLCETDADIAGYDGHIVDLLRAQKVKATFLRFYARHGFEPAATLADLVADGFDEFLLRKFPLAHSD